MILSGEHGDIHIGVTTPWKTDFSVQATADGPLGRGARGPVPLHLVYEARDVALAPGQPLTWTLTLRPGQ